MVKGRLSELHALCLKRTASGDCKILVLELCCEGDSTLGRCVPAEAALLRITSDVDILDKDTQSLISSVIGFAGRLEIYLHAWVSIPCTAGCRWKASNEAHGVYTGDLVKTELLIDVVIGILGQVTNNQGGFLGSGRAQMLCGKAVLSRNWSTITEPSAESFLTPQWEAG